MNNINPTSDFRQPINDALVLRSDEETLVADDRAGLTPSQRVEQKLIDRLKSSPLLVSHIQRRAQPGRR